MSEQLETVIENGVEEISPPIEANPVETDPVTSSFIEAKTDATDESSAETDVVAQATTAETTLETEVADAEVVNMEVAQPVAEDVEEALPAETVTTDAVDASVETDQKLDKSKNAELDNDLTVGSSAPPNEGQKDRDNKKRVVRVLSVGQELKGTVKRIADFGAFVDIGVGRDGFLHVSELSVLSVGKVSDVLSKGQEVTVWIKQLDRERNRISLTMVSPDTKTIRDLNEGDILPGKVTRIVPYGAFIDLGVGRDALLHIREMSNGYVKQPEDIVQIGEDLDVKIIALNRRRYRIDLSLKGLRPEPELEEEIEELEEEAEEEEGKEIEVLSAMELAFKRAMESGSSRNKRKQRKVKQRTNCAKGLQDDIFSRTLNRSSDG